MQATSKKLFSPRFLLGLLFNPEVEAVCFSGGGGDNYLPLDLYRVISQKTVLFIYYIIYIPILLKEIMRKNENLFNPQH
jgi:hypothetical protein